MLELLMDDSDEHVRTRTPPRGSRRDVDETMTADLASHRARFCFTG
ncbi:hypothetical protein [Xylanimonas sp. McL0601]